MALTNLMQQSEVKAFLTPLIRVPRLGHGWNLVVPPVAATSSRIGTAFDYALRFGLEARGAGKHRSATIAEQGVERLPKKWRGPGHKRVSGALSALRSIPPTGDLPAAAARASVVLTGFDLAFRPGRTDEVRREPVPEEIAEIQSLYAIVPWEELRPKRAAFLNPNFGAGSHAVGGADADLVIDDLLLDVKTIRTTELSSQYVLQVIGYALLANRFGIDGDGSGTQIERVGIYYSRTGRIFSVPLCDVLERREHDRVTDYLVGAGRRIYGGETEAAVRARAEPRHIAAPSGPPAQARAERPRDVAANAIANFMLSLWARVESGELSEAGFDAAVSKYAAHMRRVHGA